MVKVPICIGLCCMETLFQGIDGPPMNSYHFPSERKRLMSRMEYLNDWKPRVACTPAIIVVSLGFTATRRGP